MPVLIVGASSDVGRRLADLLLAEEAQVRVYVREEDADLRSAGCKVAIGEYDDLGRLESAMEQVHTVVHLVSGTEPPDGRSVEWLNEETTDVAMIAAVSAEVTRFITVSEAGASESSTNRYLRARDRADARVREGGLQYAILRCAPVIGRDTPLGVALRLAATSRKPVAPGTGDQRCNPIDAGDVAGGLFLADARGGAVGGTWDLGGGEILTFDELFRRFTGRDRISHRRSVPGLSRVLADAYAEDRLADPSEFLAQFPLALTPLASSLETLR